MVTGIILGGAITSKTGRYWYSLIIGPLIAAIGGGLLFTINEKTSNAHVIGFQILLGFGIGIAYQMPCEWMQTSAWVICLILLS
jgi:MFS family permease